MSPRWELMLSRRVLDFHDGLSRHEREELIAALDRLAAHPVLEPADRMLTDAKGRTHHLRFAEGLVVEFWFDHAERVVNVMEVGRQ
ncbi:MAG: hypothetical protein HZA93_11040 [Verrucomicrobia bacterium]|nr:hypothetical protein [Verrucomicrobiota bacterium]